MVVGMLLAVAGCREDDAVEDRRSRADRLHVFSPGVYCIALDAHPERCTEWPWGTTFVVDPVAVDPKAFPPGYTFEDVDLRPQFHTTPMGIALPREEWWWGVDRIDQLERSSRQSRASHSTHPPRRDGVPIYIVDTGINGELDEFAGRYEALNVVSRIHGDDVGHGTHIASIAAGGTIGVARNARLVDVATNFRLAELVVVLGTIYRRHREIDQPAVVNLSWGCDNARCDEEPLKVLNDVVSSLSMVGVITVVSAGSVARPAENGYYGDFRDLRAAVRVGATYCNWQDMTGNGDVDCKSERPREDSPVEGVDIFAPGSDVIAVSEDGVGWVPSQGTSSAAAMVSGTLAHDLALSITNEPDLPPAVRADRVRRRLLDRASTRMTKTPTLCLSECPCTECRSWSLIGDGVGCPWQTSVDPSLPACGLLPAE